MGQAPRSPAACRCAGNLLHSSLLFAPYVRWAALHAANKTPVLINVDGIAAALGPDSGYAQANTIAVAAVGFENQNDPARNRIPLMETVAEVQLTFDGADTRRALA